MNWSERLGYAPHEKVVILHADDAGKSDAVNDSILQLFDMGLIKSASVMSNMPKADSFLRSVTPNMDIGLHLNITTEWASSVGNYCVKSLCYLSKYCEAIALPSLAFLSTEDVRCEIERQFTFMIDRGVHPTHIDCHNGILFLVLRLAEIYAKYAENHNAAALILEPNPQVRRRFKGFPIKRLSTIYDRLNLPRLDDLWMLPSYAGSYDNKVNCFREIFRSIEPGLTLILFHPGCCMVEDIESYWEHMAIQQLKHELLDQDFVFSTWREVMERYNQYCVNV
jgi:hypothetical protein